MTLPGLLAARAAEQPARDLLRMTGRSLTYGEFDREVNRLANGLLAAGVKPGEMVGVMLPNCPEAALLWLALLRIGAVEAPLNTAFRGAGLAHLLDLCGCRLLVIDESYLPALGGQSVGRPTQAHASRSPRPRDTTPVMTSSGSPARRTLSYCSP